ncbi:unnamed protein product [Diamesa serratosioi]
MFVIGTTLAASCHYYIHPSHGYSCQLSEINYKSETDVLIIDGAHMTGKRDSDVLYLFSENTVIKFVPQMILTKYSRLTRLHLVNVGLTLNVRSLKNCGSLKVIDFPLNQITSIPADTFKTCSNVVEIFIYSNNLKALDKNAFVGLSNLWRLDLGDNLIGEIQTELLQPLTNLGVLMLMKNNIATIQPNAFQKLQKLWYLNLDGSQLTEVNALILAPLVNLEQLYLHNNAISTIHPNAFRTLTKLSILSLENNVLNKLDSVLFVPTTNLKVLFINKNFIIGIQPNIFSVLPKLESLDATENYCIDNQYVLSAAHCVTDTLANRYKLFSVILGEYDQSTEEDCLPDKSLCQPPVQEIEVESYKLHELYSDELSVNDIMIIKLKHPVEYKSNIKTICLPTNENQLITKALNKKKLTITGWGRTEFNKTSDVMLYANIPYLTLDECKARMKKEKINIILHPSHICAGGADSKDSCEGDSGSPLSGGILTKEERPKIVDYQFGIVSAGIGCSFQGSAPRIYTNVAYYMNWILDQMD